MTDGPFRNSNLPARWKRYGDDLVSDAKSSSERIERAESAILRDLCTKETRRLVLELDAYVKRLQKDIVPRVTVDGIFEKYQKTPQLDSLHRFFTAYLASSSSIEAAWQLGFDKWVRHEAARTQNRMVEHCIIARDRGDLNRTNYAKAIKRNMETFAGISFSKVRCGFFGGESSSRSTMTKRTGLDDGPKL